MKKIFKNKNLSMGVLSAWVLVSFLVAGCNIAYDTEAISLAVDGVDAAADSGADLDMANLPDVPNGCVSESDGDFCARMAAQCGNASGSDNCGRQRAVLDCGTCLAPVTACVLNVCGEKDCRNSNDDDQDGLVDCADDDCLDQRCSTGNTRCQADGQCI